MTMANSPGAPNAGTKLRTTCKECALSKVRCDKQKPICRRCELNGLHCVYDRSKRRGKPRLRPLSSTQLPIYSWPNVQSFPNIATFPDLTNPLLGQSSHSPDIWSNASMLCPSVAVASERDARGDGTQYLGTNPTASVPHTPTQTAHPTATPHRSGSRNTYAATLSLPMGNLDRFCSRESCASDVLRVIESLQSTACANKESPVDNPSLSSDVVLRTNRIAITQLRQVSGRACVACSQDSTLSFLFATALSKILAWYNAVLTSIAGHTGASRGQDIVVMTPITMGDLQLEPAAERRMNSQLLAYELQGVNPLLDHLEGRRSGIDRLTGVSLVLDQYLRESLRDLHGQVQDLIASGPT